MNITKEILQDNGIVSMFFTTSTGEINCILRKKNRDLYFFDISNGCKFEKEKVKLTITKRVNETIENTEIYTRVFEAGFDYVIVEIERFSNDCMKSFFNKMMQLELQDEKYVKRREERIQIGKKNYSLFELTSPEQKLFFEKNKLIQQPCALIDASIHGICIITNFENIIFKEIENFNININFVNPIQFVNLKVHRVNIRLRKTETNTYAIISCQLLEPVPYIWKERVIKCIEKLNIEE